ncbi:MAG: hypothetical protein KF837_15785 [Labilithrix sp.]|nr:hypothetical protein [Labilithrix sp.]
MFLLCATLAAGCATEDPTTERSRLEGRPPPTLVPGAVTADKSFSDDVRVADDRLVIASTGHEDVLSQIEVGTVVAGDRAKGMKETNPYGFLRRVTKIEKDGADTVLMTEKAELTDWIHDGRLDFSSTKSLLRPGATVGKGKVVTRTLRFQANEQEGSGGGSGEETTSLLAAIDDAVKLENATLTVKASFDGYLDVRHADWWGPFDPPEGAAFKSVLTLEPSISADIVVSVAKDASIDKAWTGPEVTIPIPAPIPVTVSFKPELKCNLSAGGSLGFTVGANIGARGVFGFEGDVGLDHFDQTNLSQAPTASGGLVLKSIEGKATVSVRCEIVALPKVLAFDALGMEGRMGPWLKLSSELCALENEGGKASGVTLREEHGLTGNIAARVQVPIFDQGHNVDLASFDFALGDGDHYLHGSADTCKLPLADSCAGRADGLYCSELAPDSAIICEAGVIARGLQCEANAKCTGGTPDAIQCQ